MPSSGKPAQQRKGGKKGSNKAPKLIPDPDAAYRQQLEEALYVSRSVRQKVLDVYGAAVDTAIMTIATDPSLLAQDAQSSEPIPFVKVPTILRSLGICVTDDQIEQIKAMITYEIVPAAQTEARNTFTSPILQTGSYADRSKLRQLLVELLHTRVLAYDPQVLAAPHPKFPERVSSVVYRTSEADMRACFSSVWEATGKKTLVAADGSSTRCVAVDQLEELLKITQKEGAATEPLTQKELQDFYLLVKHEDDEVIKEDAFLNCLINVH